MKKLIITVFIAIIIASCFTLFFVWQNNSHELSDKPIFERIKKKQTPEQSKFDKSKYSIQEPGSLWWIVSKTHPLPEGYEPSDLVTPNVQLNTSKSEEENKISSRVSPSLEKLFLAAKADDLSFFLASGYRSAQLQATYYNNYVRTSGQAEADRYSARPGTSEHQTGLALDVASTDRVHYLEQAFGSDKGGVWLAQHAYEYGFIIRYPEGKESITGYLYEPWHLRFVGKDLAKELHKNNQTMEEFFNTE